MKSLPGVDTLDWLHQIHYKEISNPQVIDICGVVKNITSKEDYVKLTLEDGLSSLDDIRLCDNNIDALGFNIGDVIKLQVVVSTDYLDDSCYFGEKTIIVFQRKDLSPIFEKIKEEDYPESIKLLLKELSKEKRKEGFRTEYISVYFNGNDGREEDVLNVKIPNNVSLETVEELQKSRHEKWLEDTGLINNVGTTDYCTTYKDCGFYE